MSLPSPGVGSGQLVGEMGKGDLEVTVLDGGCEGVASGDGLDDEFGLAAIRLDEGYL